MQMTSFPSVVGIDFGASYIDIVQTTQHQIVEQTSIPTVSFEDPNFEQFMARFLSPSIERIFVTGWGARFSPRFWKEIPVIQVSEIEAIGRGAQWTANRDQCLAVSLGSGTCMVSVQKGDYLHRGGTAVGGRTLLGLAKLMLNQNNILDILKLASQGCLQNIDLTVEKIYPQGVGSVLPMATAAHFGDLAEYSSADIALGLVNLVSQSMGALALSMARAHDHNCLVFTGKLATSALVQDLLRMHIQIFEPSFEFIFPTQAAIATAIGSTLG